jgi:DNA replication protein DnaC
VNDFDPYDDDALLAEAQHEARQQQAESRLRALLRLRPPAFADEGQLHPQIQDWIQRFLQGHPGSLILIGAVGTGKTWSAWKTAETLTRQGWRGRFEMAPFHRVKAATDLPIDHDQLRAWTKADLLTLDEIAAQHTNDWTLDALGALIDERWQNRRPTLVTSNYADLKTILGDRAASRLADGATIITFTGADRRRAR